jgi:hypothetical protein
LPALDLDVPAGQSVQAPLSVLAVAPAFANLPAGHTFAVNVEHDDDPAREYVPDVQVLEQLEVCKPVVAPEVPAGQSLHVARI